MTTQILFTLTAGTAVIVALLLAIFTRRRKHGPQIPLRPLPSYTILREHIGHAVESGSQLHLTLGRAGLSSIASPTSLAALTVLDVLAKDGCANGTPPVVTVGEGTLLPAAQDSLLHAYNQAQFTSGFQPSAAQFIASETDPYPYAAGVTTFIHQSRISNNVAVGRFGAELALIAIDADRQATDQVIGTDDPLALAMATAVTDHVLIGEELLVAGAYLQGKPDQIASVQIQDLLRLILSLTILGYALYQFLIT